MNEIDLFVHVNWKSTFYKKSFSLTSRNMLNVLWCVTHVFMIFVVLGRAQQITSCHNSLMRLIVECFVWHHVEWSGIGNCNIVTLFNMHDAGSCFFSKSFERGGGSILVLFSFRKIRIMLREVSRDVRIQFRMACSLFARSYQTKVRIFYARFIIIPSIRALIV